MGKKMYFLTMIIPAFNCDDCLSDAINSIINQTIGFENIELIIVDDCSTDSTRDVIKYYEKKYSNIKGIFLTKNNGVAGIPRNIGIRNATSKYLMFLDADDEYDTEACEIFYNKIVETGADFVFSGWLSVRDDKISKSSHKFLKETKEFTFHNGENIREWYKYFQRSGMTAGIYNKEFVLINNIKCHEALGEDGYFQLKALFNAKKIVFIEYWSYYNKLRDTKEKRSITNIRNEKMFRSREKSIYYFSDLMDVYGAPNKQLLLNHEVNLLLWIAYTLPPSIHNKIRKEFFIDLNNLEKKLGIMKFDGFYANFLNKFVVKEHYTMAILISRILGYIFSNYVLINIFRR